MGSIYIKHNYKMFLYDGIKSRQVNQKLVYKVGVSEAWALGLNQTLYAQHTSHMMTWDLELNRT